MIQAHKIKELFKNFLKNVPFDHGFVDNFLDYELAQEIEKEFLDYNSDKWFVYKNQIEDKKAQNDWNVFPSKTYQLFQYMNSQPFVNLLSKQIGVKLYADSGLHGGGYHMHGTGGNLNPHLDYSIHPKLGIQRKLNIIIYISSELKEEHGGHLGLWSHDEENAQPNNLIKEIMPKYNRAIAFDTTQNSWHGMSRPLTQPEGIYRKSLAAYYLCNPTQDAPVNNRAIFAPREEQKGDSKVVEVIKLRSDIGTSWMVYKTQST
jgi:Rps23 Pro-64 3,4-dihydroxylase Tpa1-like proline 4-hydroxylase